MKQSDFHRLCSPWIESKNTAWEAVLHLGRKICYPKGSMVGGNGEQIDHLNYLYQGKIKLSNIHVDGNEKIVWYFDKGNIFGEVPFVDRKPCWNVFLVIEDCVIYTFSRQCIYDEILPNHPELVLNLVESLANKLRIAVLQSSDLDCLASRVCKMLIYVAEREAQDGKTTGRVICTKGISQQELACLLGIHRVTLNSVIAQLKLEGIIEHIGKKCLIINDYERLLEKAQ